MFHFAKSRGFTSGKLEEAFWENLFRMFALIAELKGPFDGTAWTRGYRAVNPGRRYRPDFNGVLRSWRVRPSFSAAMTTVVMAICGVVLSAVFAVVCWLVGEDD
jgi:ABC-type phosphate/phosphonate transport system permease subunit